MHVGDIDVMIDVYIYILSVTMECKKNYNSRGLCRVPWARHSAKIFQKKIYIISLLSASPRHSAKYFFKKIQKFFAECLNMGTRQRNYLKKIKKTLPSAWAGALGKVLF